MKTTKDIKIIQKKTTNKTINTLLRYKAIVYTTYNIKQITKQYKMTLRY